jgi:hypothetical protein
MKKIQMRKMITLGRTSNLEAFQQEEQHLQELQRIFDDISAIQ